MREWTKAYVALGFVAALAVAGLCFNVIGYGAVCRLAESIDRSERMTTVTSTWTSGGIQHSITTTRREDESAADWAARHRDELAAALLLFPKDP